jgi:hypothetical protein
MENWTVIKDVLTSVLLLGILVAWLCHIWVSWRNDIRRNSEVNAFISLFQSVHEKLLVAYANVVSDAQAQNFIMIVRNRDGSLTVGALAKPEQKKIEKELERQGNSNEEEETHEQGH